MTHRWLLFSLLLVLIAAVSPQAGAGEPNVFELTDGTTVIGSVTDYSNGVYTVTSPSLGTIRIPESEILVMRKKGGASGVQQGPSAVDIQALQQLILADPQFSQSLSVLQEDASVQRMLEDPEFRKALESGDYQALMNTPQFQQLLNHPEIQKMMRDILRQME